ncbi:SemiSWEET transporter [Actinoplanes sp. NPDC051633]|uniref:SemiSWEET transporter n=1 Tax=Actinoplanes sp. NPDC051633 TaxID=3155670 RepID=UPI003421A2B3
MYISALGCLGAALSMTLPWPQIWRSCVGRRTTGLSATACWLGVAMPIGWITYGLLIGDRLQVLTNIVTGAAGFALLVALLVTQPSLRTRKALAGSAAGAIAVLAAAGLAASFGGLPAAKALGGVLAVTAILAAVPQPLSLLRDRTQDLSGLSPLRWRLGAGACASWFVYGLATAQPGVWLSASAGLTSALIVCTLLWLRRTPAPARPRPADRVSANRGRSVLSPSYFLAPRRACQTAAGTGLSSISQIVTLSAATATS